MAHVGEGHNPKTHLERNDMGFIEMILFTASLAAMFAVGLVEH